MHEEAAGWVQHGSQGPVPVPRAVLELVAAMTPCFSSVGPTGSWCRCGAGVFPSRAFWEEGSIREVTPPWGSGPVQELAVALGMGCHLGGCLLQCRSHPGGLVPFKFSLCLLLLLFYVYHRHYCCTKSRPGLGLGSPRGGASPSELVSGVGRPPSSTEPHRARQQRGAGREPFCRPRGLVLPPLASSIAHPCWGLVGLSAGSSSPSHPQS